MSKTNLGIDILFWYLFQVSILFDTIFDTRYRYQRYRTTLKNKTSPKNVKIVVISGKLISIPTYSKFFFIKPYLQIILFIRVCTKIYQAKIKFCSVFNNLKILTFKFEQSGKWLFWKKDFLSKYAIQHSEILRNAYNKQLTKWRWRIGWSSYKWSYMGAGTGSKS